MADSLPTIFIDLSNVHVKLIEQSDDYKKFKETFRQKPILDKRQRITPGTYLREHIIDHYTGNRKDPSPEIVYDFDRGEWKLGKLRFILPPEIFEKFEHNASSNLRSLKAQALYLVIPLISSLIPPPASPPLS